MTTPCYYRGKKIGSLSSKSCGGSRAVSICMNESVPSGLCSPNPRSELAEGKVVAKGHACDGEQVLIFPFDQGLLDKGKSPWDNWVLLCPCCPWQADPPTEVKALYERRQKLQETIEQYESVDTLEARANAVKGLS
jgi:hypothetical protein